MASMRDRLKAKNAENAESRGNTSTDSTVFADFANRDGIIEDNNTTEDITTEDTIEEVTESNSPEEDIKETDSKEPITEPVKETKQNKPVKKSSTPAKKKTVSKTKKKIEVKPAQENDKNSVIEKEPVLEPKAEETTSEVVAENTDDNKKTVEEITSENDRFVSMTISIPQELNEYLNTKAAMLTVPIKIYFKDCIVDAVNKPVDTKLAVQFRKSQHDCIKRAIQTTESFRDFIRMEAARYMMKPTAFITYCITKTYQDDTAYHEAMKKMTK